jgi:hypothetical protein
VSATTARPDFSRLPAALRCPVPRCADPDRLAVAADPGAVLPVSGSSSSSFRPAAALHSLLFRCTPWFSARCCNSFFTCRRILTSLCRCSRNWRVSRCSPGSGPTAAESGFPATTAAPESLVGVEGIGALGPPVLIKPGFATSVQQNRSPERPHEMMENRAESRPGIDGEAEQENLSETWHSAGQQERPGGLNRRVRLCSTCRRNILRLAVCPIDTCLLFLRTQMIPLPLIRPVFIYLPLSRRTKAMGCPRTSYLDCCGPFGTYREMGRTYVSFATAA